MEWHTSSFFKSFVERKRTWNFDTMEKYGDKICDDVWNVLPIFNYGYFVFPDRSTVWGWTAVDATFFFPRWKFQVDAERDAGGEVMGRGKQRNLYFLNVKIFILFFFGNLFETKKRPIFPDSIFFQPQKNLYLLRNNVILHVGSQATAGAGPEGTASKTWTHVEAEQNGPTCFSLFGQRKSERPFCFVFFSKIIVYLCCIYVLYVSYNM